MAVYTEISGSELSELLGRYAIGEARELKPIAEGVENSNYRLETTKENYILTLYEKRVKVEELPFFLNLVEHLATRGIPCPLPIRAMDGALFTEICGRSAAIVTFLTGKAVSYIEASHCEAAGTMLARMHEATRGFAMERMNAMALPAWRELFVHSAARADVVKIRLACEIASELDFLSANWPKSLPSGVIHADFFPDNALFQGAALSGMIDFYFACNDFFAYDVAITLNAWCFEPNHEFNITKARKLLEGYTRIRPLSPKEMETFPILARGAAMRFLLSRLYDWLHPVEGAIVTPKNPLEYLYKLRFHQHVQSVSEYGLALV